MPKNLWVPARPGLPSHNSNPAIPVERKLEEIKASSLLVAHDRKYHGLYKAQLPYTKGASFILEEDSEEITLVDMDIGDRDLYGHGIGARYLQHIIAYSLRKHPNIQTIRRGVGNWALVKTLGRVLGGVDQHVQFEKGDTSALYGVGGQPAETVFQAFPSQEGEEYNVKSIVGHIDPDTLMSAQTAIDGITTTVD